MAGSLIPSPGFKSELVSKDGTAMPWFIRWVNQVLLPRVQAQSPIATGIALATQAAAIGTTALIASANAGLYRISWYGRVVTAAGISSSWQLSILSTDDSIAITQTGSLVNGNTTATVESGSFVVRADGASPVSYSVAYASNPASAMEFDLELRVEAL